MLFYIPVSLEVKIDCIVKRKHMTVYNATDIEVWIIYSENSIYVLTKIAVMYK